MKQAFITIFEVFAVGVVLLALGAAMVFGSGWLVEFFAIDWLVELNVVSDNAQFWQYIKVGYVLLVMPPIYMMIFRELPASEQESIKNGATNIALAFVYIGDFLGKGALLFLGAYFAYSTLMN